MADPYDAMAAAIADEPYFIDEDGRLKIAIRRDNGRPRVGGGGYGMPFMPPLPERAPAEMRSANSPLADALVEASGQTAVGPVIDTVAKLGRATGDTVSALTGAQFLPWAARKVDALSDSAMHGWGNLADALSEGIVTTSAEAQGAADDPLEPLRTQQRILQQGLEDAMARQKQHTPKGRRAPDPQKKDRDPGYWKADEDVRKYSDDLEKLNVTLIEQGGLLDRERERKATAAKRIADEAALAEDNTRLEKARTNKSWWEQVLQNDPELLGAMGGMGVGHVVRSGLPFLSHKLPAIFGGVKGRADTALAERNRIADALVDRAQNQDWPGRIGNVNAFATSPGAQPLSLIDRARGFTQQQPFLPTGARRGTNYTYNAEAPTSASLYPQSTPLGNLTKDVATGVGIGGTESVMTHLWMTEAAEKELAEANKAVAERASEANVQRLMKAEQRAATARAIEYGGRGFAVGFGGGGVTHPRNISRPGNIGEYDAEVGRIRRYLAGKTGGGPRGGGGRANAPPAGSPPGGAAGSANTQSGPPSPSPAAPAAPAAAPAPVSSAPSYPPPANLPKGTLWNERAGRAQYPKGHPDAGQFVPLPKGNGKGADASWSLLADLLSA